MVCWWRAYGKTLEKWPLFVPTIVYVKASDKLNDTKKVACTALQTRQQDLESQRKNASLLAAVEDIARKDYLAIVRITVDKLTRKLTVTPAADDKDVYI